MDIEENSAEHRCWDKTTEITRRVLLLNQSDESCARGGARELIAEEAIQWCANDHEFIDSDQGGNENANIGNNNT